ncbi:uncharacterized protein TNCV_186321 [Trichonephila clavipes]|nr:uncharacterized protein TNCV_186321 [Trichonephila clavipes]
MSPERAKLDCEYKVVSYNQIKSDKIYESSKKVAARGLLATDHVILNHGQVTRTTPELAPPLLTTTPHQREDVSALDRFSVHRCPTRRVCSGTGLELVRSHDPTTIPLDYHGHSNGRKSRVQGLLITLEVKVHIFMCGPRDYNVFRSGPQGYPCYKGFPQRNPRDPKDQPRKKPRLASRLMKIGSQLTPGLPRLALVILNHGHVTKTTPEITPPSSNFHTTPTGGRLSSRQI